jgi:hypothetical protein
MGSRKNRTHRRFQLLRNKMAGFMSRGVSSSKINSAGVREDRFRKGKVVLVGRDDDDALARATVILAKFTAK